MTIGRQQPHIVSIGPDERVTTALAEPLMESEFAVESVSKPTTARRQLSPDVDCIVSTYRLSETDGISLLRDIRSDYPDIPFVLCVRDGNERIASDAIEAGVTRYLPMDDTVPPELATVIDAVVGPARTEARQQRTSPSSDDRSDHDRVLREAHEIMADDSRPLTDRTTELLELGREALDMEYGTLSRVRDDQYILEAVATPVDTPVRVGDREPFTMTNCERVVETERTLYFADLETDAPELAVRARNVELEISSYLGTPLSVRDDVTGTVCFFDTEARDEPFSENEVRFVERLAHLVSIEIERERFSDQWTALQTAFPDLGFLLDGDGRYLDCLTSPATSNLLYGDPEELIGKTVQEVLPTETANAILETVRDAIETGNLQVVEYALPVPAGTRWFEARVSPITSDGYGQHSVVFVARDVTERKERKQQLEEAETLFQNTQDALFLVDVTEDRGFEIQRVNDVYEELTGYSQATLRGSTPGEVVGEAVGSKIEDQYRECLVQKEPLEYVESLPIGRDSTYWHTKIAPVVIDGTVTKIVGATRDITEQKERETELAQLQRVNTLIRRITQALQNTATRDAIETAVCERLTESDLYQVAWIGTRGQIGDGHVPVVPQTVAGISVTEIPEAALGAAEATLRSDEIRIVDETELDSPLVDDGMANDSGHDQRVLVSIPLTTGETTYGVLAVYAPSDHVISESERDILEDLGQVIALAINRVQSQRSLTAKTAVELQFQIGESESIFGEASSQSNCELAFKRWVPVEDGRGLQYITVRDTDPERVCDYLRSSAFVDAGTVLRDGDEEDDDPSLIEISICDTSESVISSLANHGASITEANAVDGETYLTAEVAPESDVRTIVSELREIVPTIELLSKRVIDQPMTTAPQLKKQVSAKLTRKQEAALSTAFTRGYYAWPRESTAEEIAQTMDIASSTFHFHLRRGLDNLLTAFFEENCERAGE